MRSLTRPEGPLPEDHRLSRRTVAGGFFAGYAAAALSAQAEPIHTDTAGLVVETVSLGAIPGYLARPAAPGRHPAVIVVNEVFGIHDYIKDTCRRFAKAGYAAVAPELYARLGDLSKMTDVGQIVSQVISKAPDARLLQDLDGAVAFAAAHGGAATRLGVTGFCRGGRNTWLYAAHNPNLKAAVAWYGPVMGAVSELQPKTATDVAGDLKCPLLGLYGGKDTGIKVDDVQAAAAKAKAAGKSVEIMVYPDAPHGFHADYRPSYRAAEAIDGFNRLLGFFKAHGAV